MMKKSALFIAAIFALSSPVLSFSAEHGGRSGASESSHGDHSKGDVAHEEVIEGIKATFRITGMKDYLKHTNSAIPMGMKETHHVAVSFKDARSGKALTEGEVKVKMQNPDKSDRAKDLVGMQGHFGADFDLSKKGKYGVMSKFKLKDGKVRSARFWYTVK